MADVETTIKSSGGDYASLSLAESDDFGCTSGQSALCEYVEDMTDTDVAITTTVPSTIEISVQSAYRHDGRSRDVTSSGVQISSSSNAPIRTAVDNLTIDGLDLKNTTNSEAILFFSAGAGSNIVVKNCIVHNAGASSSAKYIIFATTTNLNLTLENVIAYGSTRLIDCRNATSVAITNCTFWRHNDQLGIVADTELTCNHTYCGKASGTQQDFWTGGAAPSGAYNAASDTSVATDYTNSLSSKSGSNQFVSVTSGSEDFTLLSTSDLVNAGDSGTTYTTTDIISTSRDATPDIGAFEYVAAGGSPLLPTMMNENLGKNLFKTGAYF